MWLLARRPSQEALTDSHFPNGFDVLEERTESIRKSLFKQVPLQLFLKRKRKCCSGAASSIQKCRKSGSWGITLPRILPPHSATWVSSHFSLRRRHVAGKRESGKYLRYSDTLKNTQILLTTEFVITINLSNYILFHYESYDEVSISIMLIRFYFKTPL